VIPQVAVRFLVTILRVPAAEPEASRGENLCSKKTHRALRIMFGNATVGLNSSAGSGIINYFDFR
jgi:hypothetical protein